ncbi:hypothetical protein HDU81_009075 [Chytriomyces hyalinus]|nr:hypothetical protein HDU81_009075 [Chytriomyces hyalinus]
MSHIAKNLAEAAVMKRGKNAKFRAKKRLAAESTDSELSEADNFDNRSSEGRDNNSPTLKHKCRTANCTRNFATLRLLQKHQTAKHPECTESKMSTPVSQTASLTPKETRKKQKLYIKGDNEIQNLDTAQTDALIKPAAALAQAQTLNTDPAAAPRDEPKPEQSDAQISAEREQTLHEHKRIVIHQAVVMLGRGGDSDDEDLNDDE